MSCVTKLLLDTSSLLEVTNPYLIKKVHSFFRSQKDLFKDDDTISHHFSDMASYVLKYLEFTCYETGNPMRNIKDASKFEVFSIDAIIKEINQTGLLYDSTLVKRFVFSLLAKPFVILSGLSGSGKTQLALAFAHAVCQKPKEQICIVPVGADWTNREPLLGYVNSLAEDSYILPESGVLQLIMSAMEHEQDPYFLILDEMNMSYVERYFADFLSGMESDKPIRLWDKGEPVPKEFILPANLFIIGTINVDETTYMFSPKVLDRSSVIEFRVVHSEMERYLTSRQDGAITMPIAADSTKGESFVRLAAQTLHHDAEIKDVLLSFFDELKKVGAEFGYRTVKDMNRFIALATQYDDTQAPLTKDDILDAAIMQKLLPKLHGSMKSLKPVLTAIWSLCFAEKTDELSSVAVMPFTQQEETINNANFPKTADKVLRMYRSALANGFASYSEA